ncbi:MAG: NUDIX hydrolase [Candidatus Micrarchaeota archaeon]
MAKPTNAGRGILFREEKGKTSVLMVRRKPDSKLNKNIWELPGGMVSGDRSEKLVKTLQNELPEKFKMETGLKVKVVKKIHQKIIGGKHAEHYVMVEHTGNSNELNKIVINPNKHYEWKWFTIKDASGKEQWLESEKIKEGIDTAVRKAFQEKK